MPKAKKKPQPTRFKNKPGRPAWPYDPEIGIRICELMIQRKTIEKICGMAGMPSHATLFKWLRESPEFSEAYARAREIQAETFVEEILAIADDGLNDKNVDDDGKVIIDFDHIQRSKLRVDARKWVASHFAPKKYGERIQQEITGKDGEALQVQIYLPDNGRQDSPIGE